ncbi:MAG: S41 family peptidase [Bacteroidaceae bacterium]|nr:S41 family peptidase [Bacteroidaceae bacterium]
MKRYAITLLLLLLGSTALLAQNLSVDLNRVRKLIMAEGAINSLYVEDVNEEKIIEAGIVAMLKELDPHSVYNNAEEVKKMNEPLQGNFEGIGVQFNIADDTLLVIQTISGGPSQRVGIYAGDRIVTVNDTAIAGVKMDRNEIMKRLRGPKGTKVHLGVVRRGIKEPLSFVVTRDKIPVNTLEAAYMLNPTIGYIRLGSFGQTSHKEVVEAMNKLKQEGMEDLIFDLEDNGGGLLQAAAEIANEFLQEGQLIVYTQGRRVPRQEFSAVGKGKFQNGRLVVLINEYSASASEIVTGAVQDWDRAYVVGRRSFGKGLVQRPIMLPDESMIRLTVAHYYTPSGRCVQKPFDKIEDYSKEIIQRYNKGELSSADSIHFPDSLKYYTKIQHRPVYGGGGIMPDRFVPLDTVAYTKYHRELVAKGAVNSTNVTLIDKNRKAWEKKYPTFDKFKSDFEVTDDMLKVLRDKAEEAKVTFDQEQYEDSLPLLKLQIKALIARDLWDTSEYFEIINDNNDALKAALDYLTK